MIRGTTPDYVVDVKGHDLTNKTVYVTLSQDRRKVTLTGDRLAIAYSDRVSSIVFRLTQSETLGFKVGNIEVQVRFINAAGTAFATNIAALRADRVLLEEVIEYV